VWEQELVLEAGISYFTCVRYFTYLTDCDCSITIVMQMLTLLIESYYSHYIVSLRYFYFVLVCIVYMSNKYVYSFSAFGSFLTWPFHTVLTANAAILNLFPVVIFTILSTFNHLSQPPYKISCKYLSPRQNYNHLLKFKMVLVHYFWFSKTWSLTVVSG